MENQQSTPEVSTPNSDVQSETSTTSSVGTLYKCLPYNRSAVTLHVPLIPEAIPQAITFAQNENQIMVVIHKPNKPPYLKRKTANSSESETPTSGQTTPERNQPRPTRKSPQQTPESNEKQKQLSSKTSVPLVDIAKQYPQVAVLQKYPDAITKDLQCPKPFIKTPLTEEERKQRLEKRKRYFKKRYREKKAAKEHIKVQAEVHREEDGHNCIPKLKLKIKKKHEKKEESDKRKRRHLEKELARLRRYNEKEARKAETQVSLIE